MYTTESGGDVSSDSIALLSSNNLDTTALAAATGIVPFNVGPGATGPRWSGNESFCGSSKANKMAANAVTRNWGMTMKMLWIPY